MKIVAFGGGHGLAATLRAARELTDDVVAVVSMADDGGSSGRLRQEFGVLPPGDVRMALLALADESLSSQAALWSHRFAGEGDLAGHNLGNLLLTALWQQAHTVSSTSDAASSSRLEVGTMHELSPESVIGGIEAAGQMLGVCGRVLPISTHRYSLTAEAYDATGNRVDVQGQADITTSGLTIQRVATKPHDIHASDEVLAEISHADAVVLGPGSWFTSVLAALAVPGIVEAIAGSAAAVTVVANLRPQVGETQGFTSCDYLLSLQRQHNQLKIDSIIVPPRFETDEFRTLAAAMGTWVVARELSDGTHSTHDSHLLAQALAVALAGAENSTEQGSH